MEDGEEVEHIGDVSLPSVDVCVKAIKGASKVCVSATRSRLCIVETRGSLLFQLGFEWR